MTVCPATVRVPLRGKFEGFASIVNVPTPLPRTLAPAVMAIQLVLLVAFQLHALEDVATETFFSVELELTENDESDTEYEHDDEVDAAAWLTVMVLPPMVSVPLRLDEELLAAIEKVTLPFPAPLAPDVTVIQFTLLTAVQAQALGEGVTVTLLLLPLAPTDTLSGDTV